MRTRPGNELPEPRKAHLDLIANRTEAAVSHGGLHQYRLSAVLDSLLGELDFVSGGGFHDTEADVDSDFRAFSSRHANQAHSRRPLCSPVLAPLTTWRDEVQAVGAIDKEAAIVQQRACIEGKPTIRSAMDNRTTPPSAAAEVSYSHCPLDAAIGNEPARVV